MNENLRMNLEVMGLDNEALIKRLEKIENIFIDVIKADVTLNDQTVKDDIVNSIK